MSLKVVCVRTGRKYPLRYVLHLQRMVERYLPYDHEFICLTDQQDHQNDPNITFIDISHWKLHTWFAKMLIFNHDVVGSGKILYIDLDMVIAGDLRPLVDLDIDFGICQNFTQIRQTREGKVTWPCRYGSCVMLLSDRWARHQFWEQFWNRSWQWITEARQFGDQWIIEKMYGGAVYLQDMLPEGYFLHYRDFTDTPKPDAHILVFAGKSKPMNCKIEWIKKLWNCH